METFLVNFLAFVVMFMLLALAFVLRTLLMRRAVFKVIGILRKRHSRCSETPKTRDELGLTPPDLLDRFTKPKDYKPYALQALIEADAVRVTEGEKVCLVEEKLDKGV